jgi:hypothetical protein
MSISAINSFGLAMPQTKSAKASSASFESILNKRAEKTSAAEMFSNVFPSYNVSCKVGNCNVSSADWQRNDFPSWKFFEDNTKADELNNWKASGNDVTFMDNNVLSAWRKTDNRKISIIMPDELAVKMESDPIYARQILNKVYSWHRNHSELEKTLSEGYGYDGELSTAQDSYLLKLDQDGNVTDYVVTGPGYDDSMKKDRRNFPESPSNLLKVKKLIDKDQEFITGQQISHDNVAAKILYDYTLSTGFLATAWGRKKQITRI